MLCPWTRVLVGGRSGEEEREVDGSCQCRRGLADARVIGGPCALTVCWVATTTRSDKKVLVDCVQQYCYCRERKYCPHDDPADFAYVSQVKESAPELPRRALSRLPVDLVMTGDLQAAERRFGVARNGLEVCLELGFPVSVLERSPLVLHDLDLVTEINARAPLVVFSLISAPDSPSRERVRQILNPARRTVRRAKALCSHGADCESRHPDRHQPDTHPTRFV